MKQERQEIILSSKKLGIEARFIKNIPANKLRLVMLSTKDNLAGVEAIKKLINANDLNQLIINGVYSDFPVYEIQISGYLSGHISTLLNTAQKIQDVYNTLI